MTRLADVLLIIFIFLFFVHGCGGQYYRVNDKVWHIQRSPEPFKEEK